MRLGVLWKPIPALSVLFKTDYNYLDLGAYPADPATAPNDLFHITANAQQKALDRFVRSDLKIDYVFANGITLRSISGYQKGSTAYSADLDGTSAGNSFFHDQVDETIYSQEINLISPRPGPFTYILGAYFQYDEYTFPPGQFLIGDAGRKPGHRVPAAGHKPQADRGRLRPGELQPAGRLPAAARRALLQRAHHQPGCRGAAVRHADRRRADGQVQQRLRQGDAELDVDDHNFLYAFVATGFRPGGLNVPVGLGIARALRSGEGHRVRGGLESRSSSAVTCARQVDAYYNDYKNFQVTIGYPAFPTFGFELNTPNPTKIYGVEVQAEAVFGDLSLRRGPGPDAQRARHLLCRRSQRCRALGPAIRRRARPAVSCIDLKGRQQTYAPNFTFNIGGQYIFNLHSGDTLTPRLNFGHVSAQWATLFENTALGDRIGARNILSAQLAYSHKGWVATLYGTNLTDQHYVAALNSGLRFAGFPRQYGIRLLKIF